MDASSYNAMTALFLRQSLKDAQQDYDRSLQNPNFPCWDHVIITASDEFQAEGYRLQLEDRKGILPLRTKFDIVPDDEGKRIGSAGSTLAVIRKLKENGGEFSGKRVLVLHAGGNSSRTPQYSALGKLFSPIPATLNGRNATLFDFLLVMMASVATRMKDGMLLLSGDVLLLFNPLMCDFGTADAAVISFKEKAETGKNHGVYVPSENGTVKEFLHKMSVEQLYSHGATDERGNCNIDTGAIWLSPKVLESLYALVNTSEKYRVMVNEQTRLSLYGDIAYCMAQSSTLEQFYREKPEGAYTEELKKARELLWSAISGYRLKLMSLAPARFLHFGSLPEIMRLMESEVCEYESLGWRRQIGSSMDGFDAAGYNSILCKGAMIGKGCYFENTYLHETSEIGEGVYLSSVEIEGERIPEHLLLHGLKLKNGAYVCRLMGIRDNPKEGSFLGEALQKWVIQAGVPTEELWAAGEEQNLWNARLYPVCPTLKEAVRASLVLTELFQGHFADLQGWLSMKRESLSGSFQQADPYEVLAWSERIEELICMNRIASGISEGKPAERSEKRKLSEVQKHWLHEELQRLDFSKNEDFSYAIRLAYDTGLYFRNEAWMEYAFQILADTILKNTFHELYYRENARIATNEVTVRLPLRVNWGGGWTDTCPYCLENGGMVLNAAIRLCGTYPVEVRLVRIKEKKIVFDSRDMDVHGEFDTIEPLQNTGNPFDPFALQKACLLACGVISKQGGKLSEILTRLGGGFEMHSEVRNVPKGSGLGTSSILSAATVKAMMQFLGLPYGDGELFSTVLMMEQIMSTGGGWQDQVGGLVKGIKLIRSEPGQEQHLTVTPVMMDEAAQKELSERFAIIFTGQRRLARNLLRDVVGRYLSNHPDSLTAHREIKRLAVQMSESLRNGNIDGFAALLNEHWKYSKMLDPETGNTLIEQIFLCIEDLIDGKMICGAGGGGFLQVILKKGVSKQELHERLKSVFQDFPVDVWDSEIDF